MNDHTGSRAAKDELFAALASVAKALASGRRAEIIELLAQGERTVEQVANAIDQSVANTSHHLRTLARAGLVATRREGTHVHYRLASPQVAALWRAMRDVAAEHIDGIEELAAAYLGDRGRLETISRDELVDPAAASAAMCRWRRERPHRSDRSPHPGRTTSRRP